MKRLVIVAMTFVVTTSILACSTTKHARPTASGDAGRTLEADVMKVDEEFRRAKLANDPAALERILNDDYEGTNQNGNTRNKQQFLELWSNFPITSLTTDDASVSFSEDKKIATVTGHMTEVNATGTDRMRFKRVYVRAATDRWRLHSSTQERR